MLKKLRVKFMVLSMTALFVLLTLIAVCINCITYASVVSEADDILNILSMNRGVFPKSEIGGDFLFPANMSPEIPYESRYFSVLTDKGGNVIQTEISMIHVVDNTVAEKYAEEVLASGKKKGFVENYRFISYDEDDQIRIVFLDWGRRIASYNIFLITSICITVLAYILFFAVLLFFSGRFIKPVAESYEKQKQFITDAGHELKTPLAVISADADVLEMEIGENEWIKDVKLQVGNLTELTNELVYLSKMEEPSNKPVLEEVIISDIVEEAAEPFFTLAMSQGKKLECSIGPMLTTMGDDRSIRQLTGILLDNAVKYSDDGGVISLNLAKIGKNIVLSVSNATKEEIPAGDLSVLFERFYRMDKSRNSGVGGHGIGLSIAKAIMENHNGKIRAESSDGRTITFSAFFGIFKFN